jgi:hypothetical protein
MTCSARIMGLKQGVAIRPDRRTKFRKAKSDPRTIGAIQSLSRMSSSSTFFGKYVAALILYWVACIADDAHTVVVVALFEKLAVLYCSYCICGALY